MLITAASLFDGTGSGPIRPAAVLVVGDRIKAVGTRVDAPADATRVDLPAATILRDPFADIAILRRRPLAVFLEGNRVV